MSEKPTSEPDNILERYHLHPVKSSVGNDVLYAEDVEYVLKQLERRAHAADALPEQIALDIAEDIQVHYYASIAGRWRDQAAKEDYEAIMEYARRLRGE